MPSKQTKQTWQNYLTTELPLISSIINQHGYTLEDNQPHLKGERFLMQAITTNSGQKLILYGRDQQSKRVVIKATRDKNGKLELSHERICRSLLHQLNFAYDVFHSPQELAFIKQSDFIIVITEFIEQSSTFLERPVAEQFTYALSAFKAQENSRATTAKHIRKVKATFNFRSRVNYLKLHESFLIYLMQNKVSDKIIQLITEVQDTLFENQDRIEQYTGFLTHTDFVPHNFRIYDNKLYLLDFSSLQFGNKHESWARFLNFMTLYNRELELLLITYMEKNRAPEERESLQLMRLFRLGEIITYYVKNVNQSDGNLRILNQHRVDFWTDVLAAEIKNERISETIVKHYQTVRDQLRSADEKERQIGLH